MKPHLCSFRNSLRPKRRPPDHYRHCLYCLLMLHFDCGTPPPSTPHESSQDGLAGLILFQRRQTLQTAVYPYPSHPGPRGSSLIPSQSCCRDGKAQGHHQGMPILCHMRVRVFNLTVLGLSCSIQGLRFPHCTLVAYRI